MEIRSRWCLFVLLLNTKRKDIVRAVHENITYRFLEIVEIIKNSGFKEISSISVGGGESRNNFLIQYQADLFGTQINRLSVKEITSLGCFYLAGLKSGLWKDVKSLKGKTIIEKIFYPENDNTMKMENYKIWKSAVESVLKWHNDLNILKE